MVSVSASVNLLLHHKVQKFSSGTDSPGWSLKKGCKTAVVVEQEMMGWQGHQMDHMQIICISLQTDLTTQFL